MPLEELDIPPGGPRFGLVQVEQEGPFEQSLMSAQQGQASVKLHLHSPWYVSYLLMYFLYVNVDPFISTNLRAGLG